MDNVSGPSKPIALISDSFAHALQWVTNTHAKIEKYDTHHRNIVADGVEYIVCYAPEHLLGIEIKDYRVCTRDRYDYTMGIKELMELARTRIR